MGEGTGGAASQTTLCRPKPFRLISARADSGRGFGPFARCIFVPRSVVREHDVYSDNGDNTRQVWRNCGEPTETFGRLLR